MERRAFLAIGASGLACACVPSATLCRTRDELIDRAMDLESKAMAAAYSHLGGAVDSGSRLAGATLNSALALYEEAIAAYGDALRLSPDDVLVLELLAQVQMESAALEALAGRDPRHHLAAALAAVRDWQRISPSDPLPAAVLAQNRDRAERIAAWKPQIESASLGPDEIRRWQDAVA